MIEGDSVAVDTFGRSVFNAYGMLRTAGDTTRMMLAAGDDPGFVREQLLSSLDSWSTPKDRATYLPFVARAIDRAIAEYRPIGGS